MQKTEYAKVKNGRVVCPRCGALLAKIYYGAEAHGVELWCQRCKGPRMLETKSSFRES
jgi:uncharacterized protein (UPF0212 family)